MGLEKKLTKNMKSEYKKKGGKNTGWGDRDETPNRKKLTATSRRIIMMKSMAGGFAFSSLSFIGFSVLIRAPSVSVAG